MHFCSKAIIPASQTRSQTAQDEVQSVELLSSWNPSPLSLMVTIASSALLIDLVHSTSKQVHLSRMCATSTSSEHK